jgi:cold-inducible RNA-binding protein
VLVEGFGTLTLSTRTKEEIEMGKRLYVGNLAYSVTESDLRTAFESEGCEVQEVKLVMDRETGRPRGFAFVEMTTEESALKATQSLNGRDLQGRAVSINEARERTGGGGGGYGGGGGGGGYGGGGGGGRSGGRY